MRAAVVMEARSWLGTPYAHMGKVKGVAADCGQLLIQVYSRVGAAPEIETGDYPRDWHFHRSEQRYLGFVLDHADPVDLATDSPRPGDIALFRFGRCISHGGIVTEWPRMIHAYAVDGCVVETNVQAAGALSKRLVGFWRVKGVE